MKYPMMMGSALALGALMCAVGAAADLKSGPQVGSSKITPFNPLHVNGPDAGNKVCLV